MQLSDRVDPALIAEIFEKLPSLRLHERVILVGFRRVNVRICWHNIVIPCQHHWRIEAVELCGMREQTLHPRELVIESWTWLRIAIGRIERSDEHTVDGCLDVAALRIARITGKCGVRNNWLTAARKYSNAVPRFLSPPDAAVDCPSEDG